MDGKLLAGSSQIKLTKNPGKNLYPFIFESAEANLNARAARFDCITGPDGMCNVGEETTGDYLVIVKRVDDSPLLGEAPRSVYTGLPKSGTDFDATGLASKEFQFIDVIRKTGYKQRSGGAKRTVATGSYLDVVYPDYAIWEAGVNSYIYSFIFTSDVEWTVDICGVVPTGYNVVGVYDAAGNFIVDATCNQTLVAGVSLAVAFEVLDLASPAPEFNANGEAKGKGKAKGAGDTQAGFLSAPQTFSVTICGEREGTDEKTTECEESKGKKKGN